LDVGAKIVQAVKWLPMGWGTRI